MNTNEYLLTYLSDECAEISYQVSKALRFGLNDIPPDESRTNAVLITSCEMRDMLSSRDGRVDGTGNVS